MRHVQNRILVVVAAALVCATAAAGPLETITVTGSRAVSQREGGRSTIGAPIRDVSLSYAISIADLDLTTVAGQLELQRRVTAAARAACDELDDMALGNPTSPDDATCVDRAFDEALELARSR